MKFLHQFYLKQNLKNYQQNLQKKIIESNKMGLENLIDFKG